MSTAPPATAEALGMGPHPGGGWYRRLWTSSAASWGAGPGSAGRAAASAVQHLTRPGETSAWHRTGAEELWLHQDGPSLVMQWGGSGPDPVLAGTVTLGAPAEGAPLHALVPGRTWRRTLPATGEVLVARVVSPGFTLEDLEVR